MPTIAQLPVADSTSPTDELPVAQGDVTRGVSVATLLANLQPLIVLNGEVLVGRTSPGAGGVEVIATGIGLALAGGTLSATGGEQAGFALEPALTLTDEVILNGAGQPKRMAIGLLRGLFKAGDRIAIDPSGVISVTDPAFLSGLGAPSSGAGVDGDTFLDIASGNLWGRAAGLWTPTGDNILAPEASARAAGLAPLVALKASSTGTIPVPLTPDGTIATLGETLVLPDVCSVMRVTGCVTAQDLSSGDAIIWDVAAAIKRIGPGSMPQPVSSAAISVFAADQSMLECNLVLVTNQAGGGFECVGLNEREIHWSAALLVVSGT